MSFIRLAYASAGGMASGCVRPAVISPDRAGLCGPASKVPWPYACRRTEEARQALTQDRNALEAPAAGSAPARPHRTRADRPRDLLRVPRVLRVGRGPSGL